MLLLLLATLAGGMAGCAHGGVRMDLPPVKLVGAHPSEGSATPEVRIIDADAHFNAGVAAFRQRDYQSAAEEFHLVATHFPDDRLGKRARYNLGVSLKLLERFDEAAEAFKDYLARGVTTPREHLDASLYYSQCLELSGKFAEALAAATAAERSGADLSDEQRMELLVRRGRCSLELGDLSAAELLLTRATNFYSRSRGSGKRLDPELGAAAWYWRGRIEVRRFDETVIQTDTEEEALLSMNRKAGHIIEAQRHFLLCIMEQNPSWAAAAGFEMGRMYEELYDRIMDHDPPAAVADDPLAVTVYRCMIREFISGMVRKALVIYNEVIKLGERADLSSQWLAITRERLEKLEQRYTEETRTCEEYRPAYIEPLNRYLQWRRQKTGS